VLGASGIVGRFLLARLSAARIQSVAVSRKPQPALDGVRWLTADLADRPLRLEVDATCATAFSTIAIWELAAAIPALSAVGVRRLVAFSSTSRFTKPNSPIASERDVARLLAGGEDEVQSACEKHGIAWTILRPTLIYSEGQDGNITRIAHLIRRIGVMPLSGAGAGRRQPVHAEDLAVGAIAAAASASAANQAYDLPGGETLSYRTMVERVFEGMGRRPRIITVPPGLWRLGFAVASRWLPGTTAAMGSRMAENLVFSSAPAKRDFHWDPRDFRPRFPVDG
jgi:nucleoside-diphosphate-sugar epimerase